METQRVAGTWQTSLTVSGLVTLVAAMHYFYLPTYVSRVRIQGTWNRTSHSNFIVYVRSRLVVNEILRDSITYDGTQLVTNGGTVEIQSSGQIAWTFTQTQ